MQLNGFPHQPAWRRAQTDLHIDLACLVEELLDEIGSDQIFHLLCSAGGGVENFEIRPCKRSINCVVLGKATCKSGKGRIIERIAHA